MLRLLNPHTAHKIAISLLKNSFPYPKVSDPHEVFGIRFPNRLGISAGFDKNGVALRGLSSLGFGHVEVGTMTLNYSPGLPNKRLERLPFSLVNKLGLPNDGVNTIRQNIKGCKPKRLVVGGSIAIGDFSNPRYSATELYDTFTRIKDSVDYVVFNPSCPNVQTPKNIYSCLSIITKTDKPILIKLSIMEDKKELEDILNIVLGMGVSGVICSNTSPTDKGGLSGRTLTKIGHQQLEWVKENSVLPVISSGGVMTPQDAVDRIRLGADLVQVYTGFVYGGITFPYRVANSIKNQ